MSEPLIVLETEAGGARFAGAPSLPRRWLLVPLLIVLLVVALVLPLTQPLARETKGYLILALMLLLFFIKAPVAVSMAGTGALGIWVLAGPPAFVAALRDFPFRSAASWELSVLPLFVLMGVVLWRGGITEKVFEAARYWLFWLPGSLAVATNFAGAMLAAASGSTIGISYALGRVAIPEMLKQGYDKGLATGSVCLAGVLGQLIPPSILLVIYAGVAHVSVGRLLLAAFVPGIITAIAFGAMIVIRVLLNPKLAPRGDVQHVTWRVRWAAGFQTWPIPFLILVVLGGLYSGVFTATEAGAAGAAGAIFSAFCFSGVRAFRRIFDAFTDTVASMGAILFLIVGITIFNRFLALSGIPMLLSQSISDMGLDRVAFLFFVMVLYIVLGMFIDPIAIMLLTVPVLMPSLKLLGIDLIWYGIFATSLGELAVVTPPVGVLAYIINRLANDPTVRGDTTVSLVDVFRGCSWFVATDCLVLSLLIFYPGIVHFLPRMAGFTDLP